MLANSSNLITAKELQISAWINSDAPLTISGLKGKIVVIHAFQMLCPGCVSHGIPQTVAIEQLYRDNESVQIIGLHTVFEHHQVMTLDALRAFVGEYRISFPVAVDQASQDHAIPKTMAAYELQGTPSLIIIDQYGYVRLKHFGQISDMQVGSIIGSLLAQGYDAEIDKKNNAIVKESTGANCDEQGCAI